MLISQYVEGVRSDLESLARLGGPDFEAFAGRLAEAVGPALRARLLEALNLIVADANVEGDNQDLGLALAGDEVTIVRQPTRDDAGDLPKDYSARFALRLPEEVKARVEQLAQQAGTSANGWIVRALARETASGATRAAQLGGRQLRGTGRS